MTDATGSITMSERCACSSIIKRLKQYIEATTIEDYNGNKRNLMMYELTNSTKTSKELITDQDREAIKNAYTNWIIHGTNTFDYLWKKAQSATINESYRCGKEDKETLSWKTRVKRLEIFRKLSEMI